MAGRALKKGLVEPLERMVAVLQPGSGVSSKSAAALPPETTPVPSPNGPSEASLYDAVHEGRAADVTVYLALASRSPGPVLELGVGTGRLLVPLLRHGIDAWGIEIDPQLVATAQSRLVQVGACQGKQRIVQGDMRALDIGQQYSLIVVAANTASLMLEDEELLAVFEGAKRHLEPAGALLFDISIAEGHSWYKPPYQWLGPTEAVWVDGVAALATESGQFCPETRLCTVHRKFQLVNGLTAETTTTTRQRTMPRILEILGEAGLKVQGQVIDERGDSLNETSTVAYVQAVSG